VKSDDRTALLVNQNPDLILAILNMLMVLNLFYVKIHVKLPQVFTILREYSHNVCSAMINFTYLKIHVKIMQLFTISRTI